MDRKLPVPVVSLALVLWGAVRRIAKLWPLWAILAALVLVTLLLWGAIVLPSRLLDTRGLGVEQRLKAENDLRGTLVTLVAGVAVIAGAIVGAINLVLTQRVQWRGQVTERFSKAIEQLGQSGPDKLDVRIGAVYALEQIAQDSPKLHWPIMEVLTAYLRGHHRWIPPATEGDQDSSGAAGARTPADAQAIATVIGRRRHGYDPSHQFLDLHGVDLSGVQWSTAQLKGADLRDAQLKGVNLSRAQLEGAHLSGARLRNAGLGEAQLQGAHLFKAQLQGAHLSEAQLQRAELYQAELQEADLSKAQLQGAHLYQAQLREANLSEAQLQGAELYQAQLQGADLHGASLENAFLDGANLEGADLTDARGLTLWVLQQANVEQAKLPTYLADEQAEQRAMDTTTPKGEPGLGSDQGPAS